MGASLLLISDREPRRCRVSRNPTMSPSPGVELAPLVGRLDAFPDASTWSVRLRRSVVPLSDHDTTLIRAMLAPLVRPLDEYLDAYLAACRVPVGR